MATSIHNLELYCVTLLQSKITHPAPLTVEVTCTDLQINIMSMRSEYKIYFLLSKHSFNKSPCTSLSLTTRDGDTSNKNGITHEDHVIYTCNNKI